MKAIKRLLYVHSKVYNLTPWTIRAIPIRIAAKSGLVSDVAPRTNATIPKIIINIEASFDTPSPENMPTSPSRISRTPII